MGATSIPSGISLQHMIDLVDPDPVAIEKGKERQRACASPEGGDYLPLILMANVPNLPPQRSDWLLPWQFGYDEQFADPDKMLYEQLRNVIMLCRGRSDAVPGVFPRYGIGFLPSVFRRLTGFDRGRYFIGSSDRRLSRTSFMRSWSNSRCSLWIFLSGRMYLMIFAWTPSPEIYTSLAPRRTCPPAVI